MCKFLKTMNKQFNFMRTLKTAALGRILFILINFHGQQSKFTKDEQRDYDDFKMCADILNNTNTESVIKRLIERI